MTKEIEKLKKENEELKDDIELKELGKEIERLKNLFYAKQNEKLEKEKEKFRRNK